MGTILQIREAFNELLLPMHRLSASKLLGPASKPLRRLANLSDASLQDIAAARSAMREAFEAIRSTAALCDLIVAQPISEDPAVTRFRFEDWEQLVGTAGESEAARIARQDLARLHPLHFPVAFPEVFLRQRPGFDVILGNPPWEKAHVEEHEFWARHSPGLRGLTQRQRESEKKRLKGERPDLVVQLEMERSEAEWTRKALMSSGYAGMGAGHPDLYKAFCWRFWRLTCADGGRIGVVLPRSALATKGSTEFRKMIFEQAARVDVTMLVNNRQWVFPEVHPQYSIGLVCVRHGEMEGESIFLRGPYSRISRFRAGVVKEPTAFYSTEVRKWNDAVSLPLLPNEDSVDVFAQLRKAPRLDLNVSGKWRARPLQGDLNSTAQKPFMDMESEKCPDGFWPVYKGGSFDLWNPDTGAYYSWADPDPILDWLQGRRMRAPKHSAHREFSRQYLHDRTTLPCLKPRIAYRRISRATDSRTVRVVLISAEVFVTDVAPYLLWPRGGQPEEAYLLGILSSIPLDWYARRFVETHVDFYVFNPLPIPRPDRDSELWRRVVALAGRLACPDERFAAWAETVGVEWGPLATDEKKDMIHELDAVVSHLYGLNESQVVHIFETFHEGWDYESRLNGVRRHFRAWKNRR